MATFKIRRRLAAAGGADVTGGTFVCSSPTITTGCLTVNASGLGIGSGTLVTKLMFGTATFAVPQFTASGVGVAADSTAIANLPAGAKVWLNGTGTCGIIPTSATVAAASIISASFHIGDHAATGGTCNHTFYYLALV